MPEAPSEANRPPLATLTETAEQLRRSRSSIYELIRSGELTAIKIGGSRRVLQSSIDALIQRSLAAAEAS